MSGNPIIPQIRLVPKKQIGIDRIVAHVLQIIGSQFVQQTNATTFLPHVENDSATFAGNELHRSGQLLAAVAPSRPEYIACETLGMDTHENVVLSDAAELPVLTDLADDQRQVFLFVKTVVIQTESELAGIGRNSGACFSIDGDCGGHSKSLHSCTRQG